MPLNEVTATVTRRRWHRDRDGPLLRPTSIETGGRYRRLRRGQIPSAHLSVSITMSLHLHIVWDEINCLKFSLQTQRPEQSVMQALESLNDGQVTTF